MGKEKQSGTGKVYFVWFAAIGGLITAIVFTLPWWTGWGWGSKLSTSEEYGQFGDQFGFANALFSGLAFAGVIIALFMQRKELSLQREEINETQGLLARQNFESMFFRMLEVLRECRSEVSIDFGLRISKQPHNTAGRTKRRGWDPTDPFYGVTACKSTVELLNNPSLLANKVDLSELVQDSRDTHSIISVYESLYEHELQDTFGRYFRICYLVLRYIEDEFEEPDQFSEGCKYARIFRAQLSRPELVVLFYNAQSKYGREKFRPLADKYSLFDNINSTDLVDPEHRKLSTSTFADDPPKGANPSP